jgi:hypothetical protein
MQLALGGKLLQAVGSKKKDFFSIAGRKIEDWLKLRVSCMLPSRQAVRVHTRSTCN